MRIRHAWMGLFLVGALGGMSACGGCVESGIAETCNCSAEQECQDGSCVPAGTGSDAGGVATYCDTDDECAMDEFCVVEVHLCVSRHECDTAEDCRPGQECRDFNGDTYRDCGFPGCDTDAQCAGEVTCDDGERARCVARACVCQNTCGGDCATGSLCCGVEASCSNGLDNCCTPDPGPCGDLGCQPGFAPDPTAMGTWSVDACGYQNVANCSCQELPPLAQGVIGNPHRSALDGQDVLHVAAYAYGPMGGDVPSEPPYGDVVLGTYDATAGDLVWTWVDGVPPSAPVVAGPSGPRGGVEEPGIDVGSHLAMAVSLSGVAHLAYRDATSGHLRYARVENGAVTARFALDTTADTGFYPSMALNTAGAPMVAWMTRRDDSTATPRTRLYLAAANSATPQDGTAFERYTLRSVNLSTLPCEGGCADGYLCRDGTTPACVQEGTTCTGCGFTQKCSVGGCVDVVAGTDTKTRPMGAGIMGSMAMLASGHPVLAVHDSINGRLTVYSSLGGPTPDTGNANFTSRSVTSTSQVTGVFPSVAVSGSGEVRVAYVNETTKALHLTVFSPSLAVGATVTVDDGSRTAGSATELHRLAEPVLGIRGDGANMVAYQDGTTGELLMAVSSGSTYNRQTMAGDAVPWDGWYGFSTNLIPRGSGAPLVTTFKRNPDPDPPDFGIVLYNWP